MGEKKTSINFCIRKSIAILAVLLLLMATLPVASVIATGDKKEEAHELEPLFTIDPKFEKSLNKGIITEELKETFEKEGFPLPDTENVSVEKKVPEGIEAAEAKKQFGKKAVAGDEWEIIVKEEEDIIEEEGDEKICIIKKEGKNLSVYNPFRIVVSCDANGTEINEFAPGEDVYVKGRRFWPLSKYKIWIQNDPVEGWDELYTSEDPSGSQETIKTNILGRFGPTKIWSIPADAPITHHEYDIVVDYQRVGAGRYNPIIDGLDSATCAGIVAPIPDVSALILFASGLVLVLMYFVYGRRRKEEGGKMRMIKKQTPRVDIRKSIAILAVLLLMATLPVASAQQKATPITNCTELQSINNDLSGDYYLANDIDCSEHKNFDPIGLLDKPFTGTFDGKGYKITNLYINRPETNYIGLFGIIASGAKSRMLAWKRLV